MRGAKDQEGLRAIGQRMETAALEMGWNAYDIAESLQVTHATVYNWFNGTQQPRQGKMEEFARLVEKPVSWLHGAEETNRNIDRELTDKLLAVIEQVREGADLGEAIEGVLGQKGNLPPHVKRLWSLQTDMIRPRIGQVDWGRLSEQQRKEAARIIAGWTRLTPREQENASQKLSRWTQEAAGRDN